MADLLTELKGVRALNIVRDAGADRLTTYRGGGSADMLLIPREIESLAQVVSILNALCQDYRVIGRGSNLLISDAGVRYPLISTASLDGVKIEGDRLYIGAGAALQRAVRIATESGLTGLEFAGGIPASVGGAVFMNAGAFGHEIGDKVEYIDILSSGLCTRRAASELKFGYRTSGLKQDDIVLGASFKLEYGEREQILATIKKYQMIRSANQPLAPSAGSVFKRTSETGAGYYIDRAGLKGLRRGGAEISSVHANFIINTGGGTAADYIELADTAAEIVYKKYGIELQKEIHVFE